MKHEEHDDLWELLGKARERKASPFFANKVMHAVRREKEAATAPAGGSGSSLWSWLRRRWMLPVAAGVCAVLAAVALMPETPSVAPTTTAAIAPDPLTEMVSVISESEEYDLALSDLLATEDNSVWLSADPSSLF